MRTPTPAPTTRIINATTIALPPLARVGDDVEATGDGTNLRLQLGHATMLSAGNVSGNLSAARHCGQEIAIDIRGRPSRRRSRLLIADRRLGVICPMLSLT